MARDDGTPRRSMSPRRESDRKADKGQSSSSGGSRNAYAGPKPRSQRSKKREDYDTRKRASARVAASPARLAALEIGSIARVRDAFAREILDARLDDFKLSAEDKAFATKLALGVAATKGTLDEMIDRALRSPDDIQEDVRDALRVSAYEIFYLDKSSHAAVDQGVELVRSVAPRAAGLANSVLRSLTRLREQWPLGDPNTDLEACARLYAFPHWLCEQLVNDMGEESARALMEASNEAAPLFISVNAIKARDEEVVELLRSAGAQVVAGTAQGREIPGCYLVDDARVLLHGHIKHAIVEGRFLVSDAASQAIAALALPEDGPGSFLEVGSGRGTKTILLESAAVRKYGSQMPIASLDNHAFKAKLLRARARDYGIEDLRDLVGDGTHLDKAIGDELFDAIFIDAPCSGLGTLRRHPEIKWRISPETINGLARTGLALLRSASTHVKPGGMITYATCTVTNRENIDVVKRFLNSQEGEQFQLEAIDGKGCWASSVSSNSCDAHFCVRLRRL